MVWTGEAQSTVMVRKMIGHSYNNKQAKLNNFPTAILRVVDFDIKLFCSLYKDAAVDKDSQATPETAKKKTQHNVREMSIFVLELCFVNQ